MLGRTALLVLIAIPAVLAAPTANVTTVTCGQYEELTCASPCERTCTNSAPVCEGPCIPNTCQCIDGYSRNLVSGKCIPNRTKCPIGSDGSCLPSPNLCIKNSNGGCDPTLEGCRRGPRLACGNSGRLCKPDGGKLNCIDGKKCVNRCGRGVLSILPDAKQTIYCKGELGEFVGCNSVSCEVNDVCGVNEIWRDCGPCDQVCGDLNPVCEKECPSACVCRDGFFRDEAGNCVEKCCPRISCNDETVSCPADTIAIKTTGEVVDGCKTTCDEVVCVPKYLEDGASCGADMMPIPGLEELQCKAPSTCLTHDFDYLPLGGPQMADAPAVCGRYGTRIVGAVYLQHLATNGVRVCDQACEHNDKCVAWQYMHRGAGRYGYCAILSGYNEQYPYFSFWWFTAHYVSAIKR